MREVEERRKKNGEKERKRTSFKISYIKSIVMRMMSESE